MSDQIKEIVEVYDLSSDMVLTFLNVTPKQALIKAYSMSIGDNRTIDLLSEYNQLIIEGKYTIGLKNFCCMK